MEQTSSAEGLQIVPLGQRGAQRSGRPPYTVRGCTAHCLLSHGPTGPAIPTYILLQCNTHSEPSTSLFGTPNVCMAAPLPMVSSTIPGLALISLKVVQKFPLGGYNEMRKHLKDLKASCCRASNPPWRGFITDLALWTKHYASIVIILTAKFPGHPFMAYLRIVVTSRGLPWPHMTWCTSVRQPIGGRLTDSALYNKVFTGRAKLLPRCTYCLAETHEGKDCQFTRLEDSPAPPVRNQALPRQPLQQREVDWGQ